MILWLNPATGVSGDMLLGALLGLGAPLDRVRAAVEATGLRGWSLAAEQVGTGGISATRAVIGTDDDRTARTAADLLDRVRRARPEPVADLAAEAVRAIAGTEAALHGQDPDQVHLHEIGGLDTVLDTVGTAAALHALGVRQVHSAPLALGTGTVRCAHGVLPAPAPATTELLRGAVVRGCDLDGETVTPTGAALLRAAGTSYAPPPPMTVVGTARGAGTREFADRPNALTAVLGEPVGEPAGAMAMLETTVDDVPGEILGHVLESALQRGAADAWTSPAGMKKSRPGCVLHVLCDPALEPELTELLLAETGTLGVRSHRVHRSPAPRTTSAVLVGGHRVRVKQGPWHAKPEHDDVVAAADALGVPARAVAERALRGFTDRAGTGPG
ncbi:nickel pincer cofactor biosynthesis protein LarC [Saccharopolyspora sp. HNM0983]|uniref:Pyridinium-3,5-bisthiocarboxylic acid mononucleotide nickel insertion protein n=1 Tax=Saccharopolyspora montiporae TaxID=2781240 RepID=A0A929BDY9_9PSEU|nr:nickel pincer cofactor biosynthesis protein LarC [Saccharopolyspora sp. HNM0983]